MALSKITNDGVATSGLPAGSILQIVEGTYSTQISTASTTFVTGNLSASITPTSTSNKILIMVACSVYNGSAMFVDFTIYRDSTNLGTGTESTIGSVYAGTSDIWHNASIMYLDSPSTTSSTTYTLYYKASSGTAYLHAPRSGGSKIYLMEIAQ